MKRAEFGSLQGLRAVVTGSSSGIGRAIALEFAAAGASLVIHCRKPDRRIETLAEEIKLRGSTSHIVERDLSRSEGLADFVDDCWARLGAVDVWVNNAGVDLLTGEGAKLSYEDKLQRLFDVDVRSTALLSHDVGTRMASSEGGAILNIGWDQADRGMGGDSGELFAAAKNAIMGLTRSLAVSLAPRVRVNCIAPGWIRTAWGEGASDYWQERVIAETPLGRWGTPEDIARMARFLASADADFITGQVINVNGGVVR